MNPIRPWYPLSLSLLFTLPLVAAPGLIGRTAPAETKRHPLREGRPMKTIGVIGGIGPQATMDFETKLHRAAQRRIPAHYNSGYPPLVVYYHRRPPVIVDENGMPVPPLRTDPELLSAAARIGPMVDFLVITSNGAHRVAGELERAAGRPVLSMVDRVVEEVSRRKWRRVGLMTLGPPAVYAEPLGRLGIACEALDEARQTALDRAIFTVMEGRADDARKRAGREALAELRARGVDGVIMGCTEVPFLLEPTGAEPDLIDPLELLAEAAVEAAMRPDSSSAAARP